MVENGSQDLTAVVTEAYAADHPRVHLLSEHGRGKGLAVRRGMLAAAGQYRFMCDADLSMPIEELPKFLPPLATDYDVAIGSREMAGAQRFNEPAFRHIQGRVFSGLVKYFALPGYEDTQCGFKCYRGQAAEDLFRVQRLRRHELRCGSALHCPTAWLPHYRSADRLVLPLREPRAAAG